ncbi:MAG: hypothetical protein WDA71_02575 [Actinomycetota bacterium]
MAGSYAVLSFNDLVNYSDAAVMGTITAATKPKWNSASGKAWTIDPETDDPVPGMYRDVTLQVSRVLFSTDKVAAKQGDDVVVRVRVCLGDCPQTRTPSTQLAGPTDVGSEVLFLLKRIEFAFQGDKRVEVTALSGHWDANWTVKNGMAVNADPRRSVPLDPLIARILKERAAGLEPDDQSGMINPLEATQPSVEESPTSQPMSTESPAPQVARTG